MARTIPENAFLYKEGLYINEYTLSISGKTWTIWELFSEEGYCFYDLQTPENYNEEGELLPEENRVHYKYTKMPKDKEYVTNNIFTVLCTNDIEIV